MGRRGTGDRVARLMAGERDILEELGALLPLHRADWEEPLGTGKWPQAAVLVALTREAEPCVLLGRRALHLPLHPGEIAFAGGKREVEDSSPWETALREALEEVGIRREHVTALGELEPLITRTGFEVYPCIASVPAGLDLIVDPSEFDSVFMPALRRFADRSIFRLEEFAEGAHTRMVPHYQIGEDNVWGVTAAILVQLVNLAYDARFELQRNWGVEP